VTAVFLHGALLYAPLRRAILGRDGDPVAARIEGVALRRGPLADWPLLVAQEGGAVEGAVLGGLTAEDLARLDHHQAVLGQRRMPVAAEGGPLSAYLAEAGANLAPGGSEGWAERWGKIAAATAADVMALHGERPAAEIAPRYWAMLVRGSSRVRARELAGPADLRRTAGTDDIGIVARRQPYAHYFALEEYDLSFRRFDGGMSPVVNRAVFISGDAVTVLPYDPARDRVHLIEQFRVGAMVRGDPNPWQLEVIAGRIDPGETPEVAARREALEEAGLALGEMYPVASYYPTVGAKSEYLYSFVALADLPDGSTGLHGLDAEAEDIRGHLVGFDRLMALVQSGEIDNAPVILTALWMARHRDRLRQR
jgi:nudix-type nucleoside diphosphatase (YffH/AdpP family)